MTSPAWVPSLALHAYLQLHECNKGPSPTGGIIYSEPGQDGGQEQPGRGTDRNEEEKKRKKTEHKNEHAKTEGKEEKMLNAGKRWRVGGRLFEKRACRDDVERCSTVRQRRMGSRYLAISSIISANSSVCLKLKTNYSVHMHHTSSHFLLCPCRKQSFCPAAFPTVSWTF